MRRILAMAVLGGALFGAAACGGNDDGGNGNGNGGDGGGTLSNEEVCAQGEEIATEYATESSESGAALLEAAETGDEAQMAQAANEFTAVTGDMADRMRALAADAEDPELRDAIEDFATELENLADALASDPTSLETYDSTGLDAASDRLDELCPTS
jgi:hypothetical protein